MKKNRINVFVDDYVYARLSDMRGSHSYSSYVRRVLEEHVQFCDIINQYQNDLEEKDDYEQYYYDDVDLSKVGGE